MTHGLGDGPIEAEYRAMMNDVARSLDRFFNSDPTARKTGFVLLVFPFGSDEGRCNYISNAKRGDVVAMLKEQVARLEGQAPLEGQA